MNADIATATPDLSDSLTVFVSTVGFPTFDRCLEHLHAQDCGFRLEIIRCVAPMSAAMQRMLDLCQTPFFIQVDEDMLLYPHAVRTLYEWITAADDEVVQYVGALYDVHLENVIYGVKIFRQAVVKRYSYRDVDGCEWDQIRRFRADGYIDVRVALEGATRDSPATLGLHGTHWTPQAVYIRYSMLERRRRKGNKTHEWVVEDAARLVERYLRQRSEIDFYALMGILSAALTERLTVGRERDYREYDRTPGFDALCRFVEEVRAGWLDGQAVDPADLKIDILQHPP